MPRYRIQDTDALPSYVYLASTYDTAEEAEAAMLGFNAVTGTDSYRVVGLVEWTDDLGRAMYAQYLGGGFDVHTTLPDGTSTHYNTNLMELVRLAPGMTTDVLAQLGQLRIEANAAEVATLAKKLGRAE